MEGALPEDVGRWLSPDGNRKGSDERETVIRGARLELRDRVTGVSVSVRPVE
ncbi:hypothetical protein [Streptomyces sp. ST2-7A]|uniref:hypothetical protein n=1 Tax=Streptomyces sp. ST2-7A TaxID=2907214 RepID=UPI001F37449E|nr:hypothetical protein [Streptomyces sp. ST2-7A]MCE7079844.1 hypothetical protein [Streptomyces sp. ST2-7A]